MTSERERHKAQFAEAASVATGCAMEVYRHLPLRSIPLEETLSSTAALI